MRTIIRNLLSVLRRFQMATFLNVAGLAIAFAAFVVILIQVNYERNFDHCHSTYKRVFRLELNEPGTFSVILPRGFVESVIQSSPHIEAGSLIYPYNGEVYFSVTKEGEKLGFRENLLVCHPSLTRIFDFQILEGDIDCLKEPDKLILPESLAHKMFGDEPAVGKAMHAEEGVQTKDNIEYTVGAVYKDFPGNTQIRNVIYTAIDPTYDYDNFGPSNYYCYLLLDKPESSENVVDNFNQHFDFSKIGKSEQSIKLTPLADIYYLNESQDGMNFRSGNKEVSLLLFFIALLIIVVAAINYTNFSTALTPLRIKSINTQKVLGSSDSMLRRALLAEAAIISLVAWLIGLLLVWMLGNATTLPFVDADLGLQKNLPIVLLTGLIALVTGLIAGLYPSIYVTSFPPALVLKGSFGLSSSGRMLRTVLISVQFIVSILLIIGASFVWLQNNYMRSFSLGFDKDQIAVVSLSANLYAGHHQTYTDRLKAFTGIEDVAFAMEKVASKDRYATNGGTVKEKQFHYFLFMVSSNFLRVMGIPIEEGRDFTLSDEASQEPVYVFNQSAKLAVDMELGDIVGRWNSGRIIGFTDNVKFTSLRQGENNIGFLVCKHPYAMPVSYIRLKAGTDVHAAVEHIRKTMADLDPAYPFDIEFYDTLFNNLYHKEENLRSLITVFSLLAIIISLVGVFGLVVFDTQYRRKEIGIRKVHGATIREILEMLNRSYIYIVLICFILAAPIGYYGTSKWLESFAYKTPMYWWVYLMALVIVLAITIGTVTFQSWRSANANPVDSLKSE